MKHNRRQFIRGSGAAILATAFERVGADELSSFPDFLPALQASGFDPEGPDSALLAVIGDVHINLEDTSIFTDSFDDALVNELNGLTPSIRELAIVGDLITHHSRSIGGPRYPSHYARAQLEFRIARAEIQRFRPDMPVRAVPGNHDTDHLENDAELWREELGLPPYQKAELGGVPILLLNSGNGGMPDPIQRAWLEAEAAAISPDQEVLILAHHPSFYYPFGEPGIRRAISRVFANHRAPVWLVGGHGHSFGERLFVKDGTRFVQMEVTTGNPNFGGGRGPGYILLALQEGRILSRIYRSVREAGIEVKQPIERLKEYPLVWPFDTIAAPAAIYEEGEYERAGRLVDFDGVDLKSHFVGCRNYTVNADLSGSAGKITEFLLSAEIARVYQPPTCLFSHTGLNGSWVAVPFPAPDFQQVYRVPIPDEFRDSANLHIKTQSDLQGPYDGITIFGWGLAGDEALLTGYEKWLVANYRTFQLDERTDPDAKPPRSSISNIEHFAFNIGMQGSGSRAATEISGLPTFSKNGGKVLNFRFARRTAESGSEIVYYVERSLSLNEWTVVDESQLDILPLGGGWEEVNYALPVVASAPAFVRVRVEPLDGGGGSTVGADSNGNGIDDLIEYAFDLSDESGLSLRYEPNRLSHPAGLPVSEFGHAGLSRLVFPRMKESARPGVMYTVEWSADADTWEVVPAAKMVEETISTDGDWEQVRTTFLDSDHSRRFYRLRLELIEPLAE